MSAPSLLFVVELSPEQQAGTEAEACPTCNTTDHWSSEHDGIASVYRDGGYWHYCTRCRDAKWRNPRAWDGGRRRAWAEWRGVA